MSTKKVTQTTQPGDWVLLIGHDRKSFIIRLKPSQQFHTHHGTIAHDDLIGAPWGWRVSTQLNYPFALLRPSADELVRNLKRTSQIVYPKDAGYILMKMNITPKSHVVEAGTGSGDLTMIFALAVSPHRTRHHLRQSPSGTGFGPGKSGTTGAKRRGDLQATRHRRGLR